MDKDLPTKNKLRKRKAELKDTTMTSGIRTYVIKCSRNNKQTPKSEFWINMWIRDKSQIHQGHEKQKKHWKKCFSWKETNETWQLNPVWHPGLDPDPHKVSSMLAMKNIIRTDEVWIRSWLW